MAERSIAALLLTALGAISVGGGDPRAPRAMGEPARSSDAGVAKTITRLNEEYVAAYLASDVGWYRDHLADDFVCIASDGSLLDREAFLRGTAEGPGVKSYKLRDVRVRTYGSFAIVDAAGDYVRPDGTSGSSRYIDVWALRDGKWKTISAQITRIQPPSK